MKRGNASTCRCNIKLESAAVFFHVTFLHLIRFFVKAGCKGNIISNGMKLSPVLGYIFSGEEKHVLKQSCYSNTGNHSF